LTFTDQRGWEIADNPQNFEPSGDDNDSVVEHLTGEFPGVVSAPEDDDVLPGVDMDFDAKPTGRRWTATMLPRSLTRLMGLGNKIQMWRSLRNQEPSQLLHPQLRHKLHHPRRGWWHAIIRSAKQDDISGASNIAQPCPGS
jgi:hypothetical protein